MLVGIVNLLNGGNLARSEQEVRQLIADANDAIRNYADAQPQKGKPHM